MRRGPFIDRKSTPSPVLRLFTDLCQAAGVDVS